jgi:hypothetical protein
VGYEGTGTSTVQSKIALLFIHPMVLVCISTKLRTLLAIQTPLQNNIIIPQSMGFTTFSLDQMLCLEIQHQVLWQLSKCSHQIEIPCLCLKEAGSENICIPTITDGTDPAIKRLVSAAGREKATTNQEMMLDIQAEIDMHIMEEELHTMVLMAAGIEFALLMWLWDVQR